jgi:hypothetical protein
MIIHHNVALDANVRNKKIDRAPRVIWGVPTLDLLVMARSGKRGANVPPDRAVR